MQSPSPSSSLSSLSTASVVATMCNPKSSTSGCLAGIFRRILCSGSLPTHPSDQITEEFDSVQTNNSHNNDHDLSGKEKIETAEGNIATPGGIVARLMGLDSMVPEIDKSTAPHLISRCRSMNSVDHLRKQLEGSHRRVNSTLSFREMPTFLDLENEEFFILSFENVNESKEFRRKGGELKQRRSAEKCRNGENRTESLSEKTRKKKKKAKEEPEEANREVFKELNDNEKLSRSNGEVKGSKNSPILSQDGHENLSFADISSKLIDRKQISTDRRSTKKTRRNRCGIENLETDCSSEDSSPVSVLDYGQFLTDPQVPRSEDNSISTCPNSRRKLSTELQNSKNTCPRNDANLICNEQRSKGKEGRSFDARKKERHSQNHQHMWKNVCRMSDREIVESNWRMNDRIRISDADCEGIDADFESQILEYLLNELVQQLAGFP